MEEDAFHGACFYTPHTNVGNRNNNKANRTPLEDDHELNGEICRMNYVLGFRLQFSNHPNMGSGSVQEKTFYPDR